jgi:phosphomannomutase
MAYAGRHEAADAAVVDGRPSSEALLQAVAEWAQDDPDPLTRDELLGRLELARGGSPEAVAELQDLFAGLLQFGTAGLRGALGPGPSRMNRAVVIRAAAGLTAYLRGEHREPLVVVGFDARTSSDLFARDTAAVVAGAGGRALVLPRPLPTPVLAFAVRHLGADAGVMVTASHNPAQDNGYKVYLGDGVQIAPPADALIAGHIARVRSVADVPLVDEGWETLGEEVVQAYLEAAAAVVDPGAPRGVAVVHSALHGVGWEVVRAAFERAGFAAPQPVPSQETPDPAFPTVAFPNPEEPGALDAALDLGRRTGADLVLANDPDADRCAAAVPDGEDWRVLTGDEVGALLGAHLLARGVGDGAVLASSIVSSRLLAAMAEAAGVRHEQTLTGFKWIARVPGLRYGYEEALGYCVDPDRVRDKDGITAALLVAEIAASAAARGTTLTAILDELDLAHGIHATGAFSLRVEDPDSIAIIMRRLREQPPEEIGGTPVSTAEDLATPGGTLPPTDALRYLLDDGSRVIVRPSGTEPKLKVYLEVVQSVGRRAGLPGRRRKAAERLTALRAAMEQLTTP